MLLTTDGASACFWCIGGSVCDCSGCLVWRIGHRYNRPNSRFNRPSCTSLQLRQCQARRQGMQKLHSTTEQTVSLIPLKEGYIIVPGLSSNGSSGISSHAPARNSRRRSNNKDYLGDFRPLLQPFKLFYKIGKKMVILSYVAITDNHGYPLHILSSEQARLKLL